MMPLKYLLNYIFVLLLIISGCSVSHSYYVVRHAEKELTANKDPELNEQGKKRAERLKEKLIDKKIGVIYSTNTIRTRSTAEPLSKSLNVPIQQYSPYPDSLFIDELKKLKKNVLIIGHSNTVDDIVNKLSNKINVVHDLADNEYDNIFIVTYKGKKILFEQVKY